MLGSGLFMYTHWSRPITKALIHWVLNEAVRELLQGARHSGELGLDHECECEDVCPRGGS